MPTVSEASRAWREAVVHTRQLSPASFDQWFSGIQFDSFDPEGHLLRLTARDEFVRDWVKDHFLPEILREMGRRLQMPEPLKVSWQVSAKLDHPVAEGSSWSEVNAHSTPTASPPSERRTRPASDLPPASSRPTADRWVEAGQSAGRPDGGRGSGRPDAGRGAGLPAAPRPSAGRAEDAARSRGDDAGAQRAPASAATRSLIRTQLNPKYTFGNFVVGPTNNLAYAAAHAAAGGGGKRYNPLFIAGGTGLGKTHLMHAIAHKLLGEHPNARVIYVSAEQFTNEFIEALQNHRMDEFRARYRSRCDLLLLDDVQFLAGREQTQEEFFHTFNALHDADKPIVLTSDKYPQDLARMPERLVSRFNSGLVADVHLPQLETRVAIVKKKAEIESIPLLDEVAVLLAQVIQSNVRELEGALIRLAAKSSLMGRPIDLEFAQLELAQVPTRRQMQMSVADIQKAVCGHFSLSNAELLSKDRHKSVAFARQVAMYLCRQRLKSSFPELGKAFGNRDHTTVMSAVKRVEKLRQQDPQVNAHLEAIEQRLASSSD